MSRGADGDAGDGAAGADTVVLTFRVPNELDGQRLDRFVAWRIPRLSRARAREIVAACAVDADGRRRAPTERVRRGETVLLVRERFVEPEVPREIGVLHRDEALTVVDKPAGLPVHPTATYHRNTLTQVLRERFGDDAPHIAHRLDRETSGIVVCARPGAAEAALKQQFVDRTVAKEYVAIVRGEVADDEGTIALRLRRAPEGFHVLVEVHPDGLEALTRYRVEARGAGRTLVRLFPETGRQHQLRVHLAAIGHPILGDKLYGPEGDAVFHEHIETGMTPGLLARLGHTRQALHAAAITIAHPVSGARMSFVAPLPADLAPLVPPSARRGER